MFTQSPEKIENNPLRQLLAERGYSVRSAARKLGISPQQMVYRLQGFDDADEFEAKIKALPRITPAKMRPATRRGKEEAE